ncbi:MAG: hypothetical protein KME32_06460 [Mojavia pulchra JT2-VF2]|uniref:Uncharacterized protein n=1 Tax=Mojavia pulchra JT2-VF2 TaxID=287848 RepID=A0A951UER2_9NOST|nr:hypothetical protein [Mojavia pulchra JT2-VF2]
MGCRYFAMRSPKGHWQSQSHSSLQDMVLRLSHTWITLMSSPQIVRQSLITYPLEPKP